jgi:hypothetical protein
MSTGPAADSVRCSQLSSLFAGRKPSLPVLDESDGRRRGVFHDGVDQEPAVPGNIVVGSQIDIRAPSHDPRENERSGAARLERI